VATIEAASFIVEQFGALAERQVGIWAKVVATRNGPLEQRWGQVVAHPSRDASSGLVTNVIEGSIEKLPWRKARRPQKPIIVKRQGNAVALGPGRAGGAQQR
jgi:hypothetical protein